VIVISRSTQPTRKAKTQIDINSQTFMAAIKHLLADNDKWNFSI